MAKQRAVALNLRIHPAKKEALHALAKKRRTDVTKLVLPVLDRLLEAESDDLMTPPDVTVYDDSEFDESIDARITFWPLPGDKVHVAHYAAARMMKVGAVMKLILRGWINKNAPMPRDELMALGVTSNQLAAIGRKLNQLAKLAHSGRWPDSQELIDLLEETAQLTNRVSEEIDEVVRANLLSWENEDA